MIVGQVFNLPGKSSLEISLGGQVENLPEGFLMSRDSSFFSEGHPLLVVLAGVVLGLCALYAIVTDPPEIPSWPGFPPGYQDPASIELGNHHQPGGELHRK